MFSQPAGPRRPEGRDPWGRATAPVQARAAVVLVGLVALVAGILVAPRPALAAPPDWEAFRLRSAMAFDLGLGAVLTDYSVVGIDGGSLLFTGLRGTYDITDPWSVQVVFRQWWLPGNNQVIAPGAGARYEFHRDELGRGYAEGTLGLGFTGRGTGVALDLGVGFDFELSNAPGVTLGPFLRYGQVINPDDRTDNDGRALLLGMSVNYHFGRAAAAAAASRSERPARRIRAATGPYDYKVPDTDHDGVTDDGDQCREVAAGKQPDPYRPGCPEEDTDGDGVVDGEDACPLAVAGSAPDPHWRGCPFVDGDNDGIGDLDDRCPSQPGKPGDDPAKVGCPEKGKEAPSRARTPAEKATDAPTAPEKIRKRSSR